MKKQTIGLEILTKNKYSTYNSIFNLNSEMIFECNVFYLYSISYACILIINLFHLIYNQAPTGLLRVEFIGWIPTEEKPTSLSFRGDCYLRSDMVGSILTLVFASGQIENIPLLYVHPADHDLTSRQRLAFEDITHSELNSVTLGDSKSFW